jgi:hypothetical protein
MGKKREKANTSFVSAAIACIGVCIQKAVLAVPGEL